MIKDIYFRGRIDFCNYTCSYCPFAKNKASDILLKREELELEELYKYISSSEDDIRLFIAPYGEAMIHSLYHDYILKIAALDNVSAIGVQSNLSFDIDSFISKFGSSDAMLKKFNIWASFHPEMLSAEKFAYKINKLSTYIDVCAGTVADLDNEFLLRKLRGLINPDIYLWLNAYDKKRALFTKDKIKNLLEIDPLFKYEFKTFRQQVYKDMPDKLCHSYDNAYINKGISNNCFFKKTVYKGDDCYNHKICDCYLGYSNFREPKFYKFFDDNYIFRKPKKREFKSIILDLDGVLAINSRPIDNLSKILESLSEKADLILATARSYGSADRLLKSAMNFFSAGVFSDGALVRDFRAGEDVIFELCYKDDNLAEFDDRLRDFNLIKKDIWRDQLLRLSLPEKTLKNTKIDGYIKRTYNYRSYIQSSLASKYRAISYLLAKKSISLDKVFFMGDNIQDRELFDKLPYTSSPLGVKHDMASYPAMRLEHILMICK